MRAWNFNGQVTVDLDKDAVLLVAAMLEPLTIQLGEAVKAMDYERVIKLAEQGREIKKAINYLNEEGKDESCGADGQTD